MRWVECRRKRMMVVKEQKEEKNGKLEVRGYTYGGGGHRRLK